MLVLISSVINKCSSMFYTFMSTSRKSQNFVKSALFQKELLFSKAIYLYFSTHKKYHRNSLTLYNFSNLLKMVLMLCNGLFKCVFLLYAANKLINKQTNQFKHTTNTFITVEKQIARYNTVLHCFTSFITLVRHRTRRKITSAEPSLCATWT